MITAAITDIGIEKGTNQDSYCILSGYDKNARLVGKVLSLSGYYGKYPCHRVVNSSGRCAPYWLEQKDLLMDEGVTLKSNGCVDLKKHQWRLND